MIVKRKPGVHLHIKVILLCYKKLLFKMEPVVLHIKLIEIKLYLYSECKTKPIIVEHKCFLFNNCRTAKKRLHLFFFVRSQGSASVKLNLKFPVLDLKTVVSFGSLPFFCLFFVMLCMLEIQIGGIWDKWICTHFYKQGFTFKPLHWLWCFVFLSHIVTQVSALHASFSISIHVDAVAEQGCCVAACVLLVDALYCSLRKHLLSFFLKKKMELPWLEFMALK